MLNIVRFLLMIVGGYFLVRIKRYIFPKNIVSYQFGFLCLIATVAFTYAIFAGLLLARISQWLLSSFEITSNLMGLMILLAPFLCMLIVVYVFCRTYFTQTVMLFEIVEKSNTTIKLFSELTTFLNIVIIAYCVFLKSSTYGLFGITAINQFSYDIMIGLLASSATAINLAFNISKTVWYERLQQHKGKISKKGHYRDRYIANKITKHNQKRYKKQNHI